MPARLPMAQRSRLAVLYTPLRYALLVRGRRTDLSGWVGESLTWARDNTLKAVFLAAFGLMVYAGVKAVDVFFPVWGESLNTQHADLRREIASNEKLEEILSRLKVEYKASRAALLRFHDGSKDISKMAFYFLSLGNIVGAATDIASLKDVPASTFTPILPTLVKGGIWFNWTRTIPDSPIKELMMRRGTRAVLFAPMPDLDHNLIGVLMLEWLSENDIPQVTDKMKADLAANAIQISGYFSLPQLRDKR